MMKLLTAPASPFGRKVKMCAIMKGVLPQIEILLPDIGAPFHEALRRENPLSKVPVLIREDGSPLYDSPVICEYLDSLAPEPRLIPPAGPERFRTLTLAALGDGIADAAVLIIYEKRFRPPEMWVQTWVDRQQLKVDSGLDDLEAAPPAWGAHPDYGHIAIASVLGYLDFRLEGKWRAGRPRLVAWLDKFAAEVPAWAESRPS